MTVSLQPACERMLEQRAAQAIIHDQGLRCAIVADMAKVVIADAEFYTI